MRIIQVSPWFYPHFGGVESHVQTLSKKLTEKNIEVLILTSRYSRELPETELIDNLRVIRVKTLSTLFDTPITPALKRELENIDFDIVHAHLPPPLSAYYASKISWKKKRPFILTYHCDMEIPIPVLGKFIVRFYEKTLGKATIARTRKIVVTTKSYSATSRMLWNKEEIVIPSCVDVNLFKPAEESENTEPSIRKILNIEDNKKIILFVGRLVRHKGIEHLIEAMRFLDDNVVLIIAGKGEHKKILVNLARLHNLEQRIRFISIPNLKFLIKLYQSTDIFVLPSVTRLEAFGLVTLEAMACGKPVIVSNVPGVRDVITAEYNGLLFETMNARDLADKINQLVKDDDLSIELGKNGRKTVLEKYNWNIIIEEYVKLYNSVIKEVDQEKPI